VSAQTAECPAAPPRRRRPRPQRVAFRAVSVAAHVPRTGRDRDVRAGETRPRTAPTCRVETRSSLGALGVRVVASFPGRPPHCVSMRRCRAHEETRPPVDAFVTCPCWQVGLVFMEVQPSRYASPALARVEEVPSQPRRRLALPTTSVALSTAHLRASRDPLPLFRHKHAHAASSHRRMVGCILGRCSLRCGCTGRACVASCCVARHHGTAALQHTFPAAVRCPSATLTPSERRVHVRAGPSPEGR
jgi:hypothetical protein